MNDDRSEEPQKNKPDWAALQTSITIQDVLMPSTENRQIDWRSLDPEQVLDLEPLAKGKTQKGGIDWDALTTNPKG